MAEYLLERFPDGSYETFEFDETTGNITVRRWVDVEPVIEANKRAHLDGDGKGRNGWHAASIPAHLADKILLETGVNVLKNEHWAETKRLLNDPDYKHLRPSTFRL